MKTARAQLARGGSVLRLQMRPIKQGPVPGRVRVFLSSVITSTNLRSVPPPAAAFKYSYVTGFVSPAAPL